MNRNNVVPERGEPTIIGIGGCREATDFWLRLILGARRQKVDMSRVIDIFRDEHFQPHLLCSGRRHILEWLSGGAERAIGRQPHFVVVVGDPLNRHIAL